LEDSEIKVKLPDHGGNSCTFLRPAPPTRQSGGVPMHGVASVYSYRHSMESWEKFVEIREAKTWRYKLMMATWGISEQLILVPGHSGGCLLSWLLLGQPCPIVFA
jgi:hypothetical protein